jgi:hypothetical protein
MITVNLSSLEWPSHRYALQPQGLRRFFWQCYAYGTAFGLLLLITGGIGILYFWGMIDRLKNLGKPTPARVFKSSLISPGRGY